MASSAGLKKDAFQWGASQQQTFQQLKHCLTTAPVLALPNFSVPFTVETDAGGQGIGVVLMQQGQPLAYFSQSIGPKAAALSTYDKEAMEILEALKMEALFVGK